MTGRRRTAIAVAVQRATSDDDVGVMGVPALLRKDLIHVPREYQRELVDSKVTALVSSWSWLACGSLLIAEREPGQFYVFDGQHRLEAVNRMSVITELPCLVFALSDIAEEAMAFYRANCMRGNVSIYDKLRAKLVGEDQISKDAVELMHRYGYEPTRLARDLGVRCIGTFLRHFQRSRELLTETWPLIVDLHKPRPIKSQLLTAIMYIAQYGRPSINSDQLRARVLAVGYDRLTAKIDRITFMAKSAGEKVYAGAVADEVNRGHRTNKIHLFDDADSEENS